MTLLAWFDGSIRPETEVRISFRDAAAMRADGVYDTARTFSGRVFRLDDHLDRLWSSLELLRIDPPLPRDALRDITLEVTRQNIAIAGDDLWVTQRISRGVPKEYGGSGAPTVIVECLPLPFRERSAYFRDGIPVVIPATRHQPADVLDPRAKTVNLLPFVIAGMEARAIDPVGWPVLLDEGDHLTEGPGANLFLVIDDELITPPVSDVLPGITRTVVLDLARELGVPAHERRVHRSEIDLVAEAFVTSTSLCICPVASLDGATMTGGIPGPLTRRLQASFSDLVGIDVVAQYLRYAEDGRPAQPPGPPVASPR